MNKTFTYLSNFQKTLPASRHDQKDLIQWIRYCHTQAEKLKPDSTYSDKDLTVLGKLFERYAVKETQISQRYLETNDGHSQNLANAEVYKINQDSLVVRTLKNAPCFFLKKPMLYFAKPSTESCDSTELAKINRHYTRLSYGVLCFTSCDSHCRRTSRSKQNERC